MRILVDPNVLVSYLLTPFPDRHPARIVSAVMERRVQLIIRITLVEELRTTTRTKPKLNARIPDEVVEVFIAQLRRAATEVSEINQPIPSVTRDPGNDYLVAHAVLEQVDCLVSGDRDLLALGEFEGVGIVSPADFVQILDQG